MSSLVIDQPMRLVTSSRSRKTDDHNNWVLAAPFRAHVSYLMNTAQVPWPVIAYQAGVPLAAVRTLIFGRGGKVRPRITHTFAARLIDVCVEDLRWMRTSQISAENTGMRIRLLRSLHIPWQEISAFLELDEETCQGIARGERTSCSVMVDVLALSACAAVGLAPWEGA